MANWKSTGEWKRIELDVLESVAGTTQTYRLSMQQWPSWANSLTQMNGLWIYAPDAKNRLQVPGSTASIVARLLTERHDVKDSKPFNYNFYLIAESTDGQLYQSPPIRTVDPAHHSTKRPDWLERCGPPPINRTV